MRTGLLFDAPLTFLLAAMLAERVRWPLWLAVALGAGAAAYFGLGWEPVVAAGWAAGGLALAAALAAGFTPNLWLRAGLGLVAALALGFGLARLRSETVAAPVLERRIITHLTGRIEQLDWSNAGRRLTISGLRSGRFTDGHVPRLARVTVRKGAEDLHPGDGVTLTAQLLPPSIPVQPGAADFARAAWFQSVGAVGFAFGLPAPAPLIAPPGWREKIPLAMEGLRDRMTARIRGGLPGSNGAIAAALITGGQGGIDPEDQDALRDAGLAHVLSISGLHMAMVGFGLFWLARAILAAFPYLALHYPIKKWAAALALAGAGFYLLISGAAPSATRAFMMLAMMLMAVLLDRPALSMRNLALAAALILLVRPEAVTEPGFQMSFSAVAGLIAVAKFEQRRARLPRGAVWRYVEGVALTSLVGSTATLPYVLFHFSRATHYAVLGNLLAMPVVGFVVMPLAALSVAALPFGLEHWPLQGLSWGIHVMLAAGKLVAGLPGAVSLTRAVTMAALVAVTLGGLWLLIWRGRIRWLGLLPMAAALVMFFAAAPPDVLVGEDARTVALRGPDGLLHFPKMPLDRFTAREWLRRDGDERDLAQAIGADFIHCDGTGCVATIKGRKLAISLKPEALSDDCTHADLVIANASGPCAARLLDQAALKKGQGYAFYLPDLNGKSVAAARGKRPWVNSAE